MNLSEQYARQEHIVDIKVYRDLHDADIDNQVIERYEQEQELYDYE